MQNRKVLNVLIVLIGALLSCYVGFHNGYPLVYPDTGTYIESGFTGSVPADRPIMYGLFARHISLATTPWLIIFAQGLLASWLLFLTLSIFLKGFRRDATLLLGILLITITTGYSYNVSILLPDIFCAMAILCLINLLYNKQLKTWGSVAISAILSFVICTHFSNLLVVAGVLTLVGISRLLGNAEFGSTWRRISVATAASLASIVILASVNLAYSGSARVNSSSHVFIINRFIENGVLKTYLDDVCDNENYLLCEYKDRLSWGFIWNPDSEFRVGGAWEGTRDEYNAIISDLVTTPKYWPMLFHKSLEAGFRQIFTFQTTLCEPQLGETPPYRILRLRFKDTVREYISSKQNQNRLSIANVNRYEEPVILFSMLFLLLIVLFPGRFAGISAEMRSSILLLFAFMIISSFVSANFSTVEPRYQNRIVWLFPLVATVCVAQINIKDIWFSTKTESV